MSIKIFSLSVFIASVMLLLILQIFVSQIGELYIIFIGWGLALIHVICGFLFNRWALEKSPRTFVNAVLGGFAVRMLLIGAGVALLIPFIRLNITLFITSLGIFYFIFQLIELYWVHRGLHPPK